MTQFSRIVRSLRVFGRALQTPVRSSESLAAGAAPKIGIALGGGFARGLAHVGVLKVLQEEGIRVDYVAGTSVGALIGALYCSGVSPQEMLQIASKVRFKDFARWTLSKLGFCTNDRMDIFLRRIVKCQTFEELRTPLAVVATDFITGDPVIFGSGQILTAVRASCAYPGFFTPVKVNGRLLVDGMLAHGVPTTPARAMGATRVIGVYLNARWHKLRTPKHIFDVVGQCFSIAQGKMSDSWRRDADVVLEPNVDGFTHDCFDRVQELVSAGERAARAALPAIRKWEEQSGTETPSLGGAVAGQSAGLLKA